MLTPEVRNLASFCTPEAATLLAESVSPQERHYLDRVLATSPDLSLEELWRLMDTAWQECGCDLELLDERVTRFYSHPVWLLNGLFIEQHAESLHYRREFCAFAAALRPGRVADIGGGFGTLARMMGKACPETEVHVVEPHPHRMAMALAAQHSNVRYVTGLTGEYDILLATDVFEHVVDPLALVEATAAHLHPGGSYLMANCFWPVIRCHLPSTFHFRWSWGQAMAAMKLQPGKTVAYGCSYMRSGEVKSAAARSIERRSKRWFPLVERLPLPLRAPFVRLLLAGLQ